LACPIDGVCPDRFLQDRGCPAFEVVEEKLVRLPRPEFVLAEGDERY